MKKGGDDPHEVKTRVHKLRLGWKPLLQGLDSKQNTQASEEGGFRGSMEPREADVSQSDKVSNVAEFGIHDA
jgi:hypothetical protein